MYCLIKAVELISKSIFTISARHLGCVCFHSWIGRNICAHLLLTTGWCCCAVSLHWIIYYIDFHLFISLILTVIYYTHTHTVVYVWMSQLLYWLSGVQLWVNVRSVFVWIRSINQPPLVFYHGVVFILSEWYFLSHKSSHKPFCISTSSSRVKRASQTHYRWSHYGFCDHSSPLSDAPIGFNPPLNPLKQKKTGPLVSDWTVSKEFWVTKAA